MRPTLFKKTNQDSNHHVAASTHGNQTHSKARFFFATQFLDIKLLRHYTRCCGNQEQFKIRSSQIWALFAMRTLTRVLKPLMPTAERSQFLSLFQNKTRRQEHWPQDTGSDRCMSDRRLCWDASNNRNCSSHAGTIFVSNRMPASRKSIIARIVAQNVSNQTALNNVYRRPYHMPTAVLVNFSYYRPKPPFIIEGPYSITCDTHQW